MIRFECPSCREILEAKDSQAHQKMTCRWCAAAIDVPAAGEDGTEIGTTGSDAWWRSSTVLVAAAGAAILGGLVTFVIKTGQRPEAPAAHAEVTDASPVPQTQAADLQGLPAPAPLSASQHSLPPMTSDTSVGPVTLEHARELFDHQQFPQALACLDAYQRSTNVNFVRWQLRFPESGQVMAAKDRVYLFMPGTIAPMSGRTAAAQFAPGPWTHSLSCVDLASGTIFWTVPTGDGDVFVDPASQDVYLSSPPWLLRFGAARGQMLNQQQLPLNTSGHPIHVQGVVNGGRYFVPNLTWELMHSPGGTVTLYDVGKLVVRDVPLEQVAGIATRWLVRTENRQSPSSVSYAIQRFSGPTPDWTYEHPGISTGGEAAYEADVLALVGTPWAATELVRLDGNTGKPKWHFTVPKGAGPGFDAAAGVIVALGVDSGVFALDAGVGKLLGVAAAPEQPTRPPQIAGQFVLLRGRTTMACVRLDQLTNRAPRGQRELAMLAARCQAAMGKTAEAIRTLDAVLAVDPIFEDGWRLEAELAEHAGNIQAAALAAARFLELSNTQQSSLLSAKFGLVRRIPSGPVTAAPTVIGHDVYFGDRAGAAIAIDSRTLSVIGRRQLPASVDRLFRSGDRLLAMCNDRVPRLLAQFAAPVDDPAEVNPDLSRLSVDDLRDWSSVAPDDGTSTIQYQGRYYRAVHGGAVKVTDGARYRLVPAAALGVESWDLALLPTGPIGYSDAGLWKLNRVLAPVEKIASFDIDATPAPRVMIASDKTTIAVARPAGGEGDWVLEIRSPDGSQVLSTHPCAAAAHDRGRLIPLAGGYLLVGQELAWYPAAGDGWRFTLGDHSSTIHRDGIVEFTAPALSSGRLFVGSADGGIYVFDTARITETNRTATSE